jgi:hypothetical protein
VTDASEHGPLLPTGTTLRDGGRYFELTTTRLGEIRVETYTFEIVLLADDATAVDGASEPIAF